MCSYSSNIWSVPSIGKAQFLQAFCAQFRGNLSLLITGIMKWVSNETKDSVGFRNCNSGQTTRLPDLHPDEIRAYAFLAFRLQCGTDTTLPFLSQTQESPARHRFTLSSNEYHCIQTVQTVISTHLAEDTASPTQSPNG